MYRVPQDKRSEHSAGTFYRALLDSVEEKGYAEVTIRDLTVKAGISRATYYRLFEEKEDILDWKAEQVFKDAEAAAQQAAGSRFKKIYTSFFNVWQKNSDLLSCIREAERTDILLHLYEQHAEEIRTLFMVDAKYREKEDRRRKAVIDGIIILSFHLMINEEIMHPMSLYDNLHQISELFKDILDQ